MQRVDSIIIVEEAKGQKIVELPNTATMKLNLVTFSTLSILSNVRAWVSPIIPQVESKIRFNNSPTLKMSEGSLHGENSCFLPVKQLDMDYYAPRIIQIAGMYPGITREEYEAVSSEPTAEIGQWTYDFSDPDGPQVGTVAIEGSNGIAACEDPVAIIAGHFSLKVPLPLVLKDPVDLVVVVDRARKTFAERKFLVIEAPGDGLSIGAYGSKAELPEGVNILGQVELVQIPWLPCMKPTKSGFMEEDEYY